MAPRNKRKLQDITNDEDQGKNEPLAKTKQKRTQKVPDRFDTDEKAAENLRPAGPVDVADEDIPKAGFVNIDTARKFNMVELVPQTGIFLYPANLDLARREKKSPTNLARKLLKNFHSPAQLAEFGSLLLVDRRIVDAILEFVRKETEEWKKKKTVAALHSDLRHMVSGLKREKTKNEAKKNAAEETEDSE